MISYPINATLCLALLLFVYKALLERERMYVFNRYYLLFGLCFAFAVPFITMETVVEIPLTELATTTNLSNIDSSTLGTTLENTTKVSTISVWLMVTISLYAIGYLLFFFRFLQNIYRIFYKIIKSVRVRYKLASLVLLNENVLPHTFLHYIFLKKEAYDTNNIAEELYTHELAHVTQKHTLDIIFIELIQIIFWFNPLLIFYKKAIQLNHEFLADAAVLQSNTQVPRYQHLLLANAHGNHDLRLASNLNFSVTKKRLKMMTKHTTRGRAWLLASLTIPIFTAALFLFSTKVIAQKTIPVTTAKKTAIQTTLQKDAKAAYYKNATFVFEDSKGQKTKKIYTELTVSEKAKLVPPPPKPTANQPTKQQLSDWLDEQKFAIWIDNKVVHNSEITKHDIVHYQQSFVHKNARSKRFPQAYQTHLYTAKGFSALQQKHKPTLGKNVVLHIKEGSDQIRLEKKKADATKTDSKEKVQRKDLLIFITKNETFLVNENYVVSGIDKLDNVLKSELSKMKQKKSITASIIYDTAVSKEFISKTIAVLNNHKIYDITTRNSSSEDEIRLPPPPPAPKKPQIKEVKIPAPTAPPKVTKEEEKRLSIMHKIVKGQKLETMMINGKKHYYVEKNGRTYIFDEDSYMVDKEGNRLPPPPPRSKEKAKKKELEAKKAKEEKAAKKSSDWKEVKKILDKS
ncbi:beta-lactamase regulating signal transducer with metallopeptidase domain [Kordia periserrulae]|uniref:Beta-lactamase regulating signal transducer with metallopeptidase domain n=1 Tax=Kordia periserrulae TaxID=701523 RepID=A0A2T6C5X8_9FLAO|nr:M56 family metallopeptidase [Kordia periserrulae]PTX63741.1 beta-lactamase regulating signal transducer with metallopeptidase domain [Kordia periserrulae]